MQRTALRGAALYSTAMVAMVSYAGPVEAQSTAAANQAPAASQPAKQHDEGIVITGSRIKRTSADQPAPVSIVGKEQFDERGFVAAGEALNTVTSLTPAIPQTDGRAQTLQNGATYPNLFNLGPGRTLTLLDGRRMVTTASGLGDRVVDTNIIPVGLIDRIDVVEAGGAAVYGSDAIAGVVNYILRKNFNGIEVDGQYGISSRGDYPERSARLTAGQNFAQGRGNVAFNVEWSKSDPLSTQSRPTTNPYQLAAPNPADTGPTDGIPATVRLTDARFYAFNNNGVIFTIPAPVPLPPCGGQVCFLRVGGVPQQFTGDGSSIMSFNPGTIYAPPFANGGQGESFGDLASLFVGVERVAANLLGHYDITDHLTLSGSALYANVRSTDPLGSGQAGVVKTVLTAATGNGAIPFTKNNPFLNPAEIAALAAGSPSFAAGAPLFVSKSFSDLLLSNASIITTKIYRGLGSLDGNFDAGWRHFDYGVSFSHAEVDGDTQSFGLVTTRFNNAINAVRTPTGQIVCSINADASTINDDPACVPINPFGSGNNGQAVRAYVSAPTGTTYHNKQDDLLATFSGDIVHLPAGAAKFSLGYEHRRESARFDPAIAVQQGLITGATVSGPTSGSYHTNEYSGELLLPLVGHGFTLPLVHRLELSGQYRHVINSVAGKEDVWGVNGQWEIVAGLTLRASRSRNFRAPTLDQLFAPTVTGLGGILIDPCDTRFINSGPVPATRRANCVALFAANPAFNGGRGLAGFVDANANTASAFITTEGNPKLQNEVSDTTTFGVVLQPRFLPGFTLTADRIRVDLQNGLIAYLPQNFTQACFDSNPPDQAFCSTFTRNANGDINTATSTTVNAASIKYRGEVYRLDYNFYLRRLFGPDRFGISLEVTHNAELSTVAAGVQTEQADTTLAPNWVTRLDLRWQHGPLRLTYQGIFLPDSKVNVFDSIETTPNPNIRHNFRHSISAVYDFKHLQLRAGVINMFDKLPSYPTTNYGDILGRRYFVGARVHF